MWMRDWFLALFGNQAAWQRIESERFRRRMDKLNKRNAARYRAERTARAGESLHAGQAVYLAPDGSALGWASDWRQDLEAIRRQAYFDQEQRAAELLDLMTLANGCTHFAAPDIVAAERFASKVNEAMRQPAPGNDGAGLAGYLEAPGIAQERQDEADRINLANRVITQPSVPLRIYSPPAEDIRDTVDYPAPLVGLDYRVPSDAPADVPASDYCGGAEL